VNDSILHSSEHFLIEINIVARSETMSLPTVRKGTVSCVVLSYFIIIVS
jgi:hypothetical protein